MNPIKKIGLFIWLRTQKIFMRKTTYIILGIMTALSIWIPFANLSSTGYSIDGEDISGYQMMLMNRDAARELSGRVIDDKMLKEMQRAYLTKDAGNDGRDQPEYTVDFSTGIQSSFVSDEDDSSAGNSDRTIDDDALSYAPVLSYITKILGNTDLALTADEAQLYQERQNELSQTWNDQLLTADEISYWEEKEAQIDVPFVYEYAEGWEALFEHIYPLNFMLLLLIAVCLSNVFSTEYLHKTNQLILSSRFGKTHLYLSKLLAGLSFSIFSAVLLFLGNTAACLWLYGADGFHAALQMALPASSWPVSIGKTVFILFGMFITVSVFYSIVTMFLSELLKSSIAVMAVLTGCMIFTMMIDIPYGYRLASQIYDLLPTTQLIKWQLWDDRLFSVFGIYLTNFQTAWAAYFITGISFIWIGRKIYVRIPR